LQSNCGVILSLIDQSTESSEMNSDPTAEKVNEPIPNPFAQTYFHGTKADLKVGDLIQTGYSSNYANRRLKHIYLSATLNAAIWGAELATGEGRQRIYLVESTGPLEDDPNVTNKKFPGNPTMSYRSTHPFKVVGEVTIWQSHAPEIIQGMKDSLEKLRREGLDGIEE
jgi:hypothetical protein